MIALAEEAVKGVVLAIQIQATEFQVGRAGREGAAAELEHGLSDGTGSPDEIDRTVAVAFIDDPGGRRAAGRGIESRAQVIGAGEEANDGTGLRDGGSAGKCFGGRGTGAGIGVVAGGGSEKSAVGGGGTVVDVDGYGRTGSGDARRISGFCGKGMGAVGKRSGIEAEGPIVGAGSARIAATVDGDLHGTDADGVGSGAGNADGAGDGGTASGSSDGDGGNGRSDVNAEVRGGRKTCGILDLHGEGEGACEGGSAGERAAGIQCEAVGQCAA